MTKSFCLFLIATLGLMAGLAPAAPALGDRPARHEFAELKYERARVAAPVPAQPGAPPAGARYTIRWITADEETEATGWDDLAQRLKAPAPKKEGASPIQHKLRVLNQLSA